MRAVMTKMLKNYIRKYSVTTMKHTKSAFKSGQIKHATYCLVRDGSCKYLQEPLVPICPTTYNNQVIYIINNS